VLNVCMYEGCVEELRSMGRCQCRGGGEVMVRWSRELFNPDPRFGSIRHHLIKR
jgi:hypothetical protein